MCQFNGKCVRGLFGCFYAVYKFTKAVFIVLGHCNFRNRVSNRLELWRYLQDSCDWFVNVKAVAQVISFFPPDCKSPPDVGWKGNEFNKGAHDFAMCTLKARITS